MGIGERVWEVISRRGIKHEHLTASDLAAGVIFHSAIEGVYTLTAYGAHWEGWTFNRGKFSVDFPTPIDPLLITRPILRYAFKQTDKETFHHQIKEYAMKNIYKGKFSYLCGR